MKVEKKQNPSIIGYLLELIIEIWRFEKKILQNLANLGHFFYVNRLYKSKFYFGPNLPVKESLLPTLLPESHSAEHPQTDFQLIDATVSTRLPERKNGLKSTTLLWKKKEEFSPDFGISGFSFWRLSTDYFWRRFQSQ
jgi:hypothetical protein